MTATIIPFRPRRDSVQESMDTYQSVRWADGIDNLPDVEHSPFFDALLKQLIGVNTP